VRSTERGPEKTANEKKEQIKDALDPCLSNNNEKILIEIDDELIDYECKPAMSLEQQIF
jgi:hypothetical protein